MLERISKRIHSHLELFSQKSSWSIKWNSIIILLFAMEVITILLFSNRGFDLTDEGVYYLSFLYPTDVPDRQTVYYYFGGFIYKMLGYNIHLSRLSVFAGLLFCSSLFAFCFMNTVTRISESFKSLNIDKIAIGCFFFIASAFGYSISPTAWSYNYINLCLLIFSLSILILLTNPAYSKELDNTKIVILYLICGLFIGIDFFIKFSSSILIFCLFLLSVLSNPRLSRAFRVWTIVGMFGSGVVSFAGYFLFFQSFAEWYNGIHGSLEFIVHGGAFKELLRYAKELKEILVSVFTHNQLVWLIVALGFGHWWFTKNNNIGRIAFFFGVLSWITFFFNSFQEGLYKSSVSIAFGGKVLRLYLGIMLLLITQFLGSLVILKKVYFINRDAVIKWVPLIGVLIIFPFMGAVGTTNSIAFNAVFHLISWFALFLLLLHGLSVLWQSRLIFRVGMFVLACFAVSQFIFGYILLPYGNVYYPTGTAIPLYKQTTPTSIGMPSTTILLDEPNSIFINQTRHILQNNGFKPGDDIVALFDMPGLVFAVGGKSPGRPWYFNLPEAMEVHRYLMQLADQGRIRSAFILIKGDSKNALALLQKVKLNFPAQYRMVGEVVTPYTKERIEIWKPINPPS